MRVSSTGRRDDLQPYSQKPLLKEFEVAYSVWLLLFYKRNSAISPARDLPGLCQNWVQLTVLPGKILRNSSPLVYKWSQVQNESSLCSWEASTLLRGLRCWGQQALRNSSILSGRFPKSQNRIPSPNTCTMSSCHSCPLPLKSRSPIYSLPALLNMKR